MTKDLDIQLHGEGLFGEHLGEKRAGNLAERFMVPPFTVLNAREGWWQDRKRAWLALGIQSELGRGEAGLTTSNPTHDATGTLIIDKYRGRTTQDSTLARKAHSLPIAGGRGLNMADALANRRAAPLPTAPAAVPPPAVTAVAGVARKLEVAITGTPKPKPAAVTVTGRASIGPPPPQLMPTPVDTAYKKRFGMPAVTLAEPKATVPAQPKRDSMVQSAPLHMPVSEWVAPDLSNLPSLAGVPQVSLDLETMDPDLEELGPGVRRGAKIAGIGVGIDGGGPRLYLPVGHEGGGNLDPEKVFAWARHEFANYSGNVVGMHLLYDLDFCAEAGIHMPKVNRFYDIGNAEPLLDEHKQGKYNLDDISMLYLGHGKDERLLREAAAAFGWKTNKEIKSNLWRMPAKLVGPYAQADLDRPLRILPLQMKKLEAEELLPIFDIETRLIPILLAMRRRGVRVNIAKAEEVKAKLEAERDRWLAVVKRLAGPTAEFMAPESLGPALEARGMHVPRTAKKRAYSVTKDWLKDHAGDELVDAVQGGRRVQTIIANTISGILRHNVKGRLHTIFNQLKSDDGGTIGRFSSEHPNLQNIPARDEELAELVRGCFEPEDGEDWERNDESQMEYRLLAHYATGNGSDEFRQKYIQDPNTDYHNFCADMLGWDKKDKYLRKVIKGINFAKGYGAKKRKLALLIGCDEDAAQEFIHKHERALPFTVKTFNRAMEIADKRGYVKSILGRRARFPLWEPAANKRLPWGQRKPALERWAAEQQYGNGAALVRANTYTALNNVLQLGNADQMKKAMVDVWDSGVCDVLGVPLLTVHDELDISVPRTKAGNEASLELQRLMEVAVPLRVPVIISSKRGPNWGATE